ncbi:YbaB/EbfC family nucleoid-associated protein [Glycomyces dulcitolivorans]|uniref:YbaB/EbfC family nucleoid-associated protein n=1 Tax=Glycomyces dulcitolivorans TaxID=2200759 RepID=UPI000DD39F80|nr:YbaB/EbfC family nucleoid-associated protein [Glycomyces dulcitolivorans]
MDNPLLSMDPEDALRRLEDWKARAEALAQGTAAASERLQALTATASDDNETVRITVDAEGLMVEIHLSSRVQKQSAHFTEASVMETYRKAQEQLKEAAAEVVAETVGADSAAGRALLAGFERRLARLAEAERD